MITPVGVIGCGRMGNPMALALLRAGFETRGFDLRPASEMGGLAPAMVPNINDFADGLRVAISVVRDIAQTDEVLFGVQALLSKAPELTHLVISSTLSPRYVRALRDRVPSHIALIDAPMSGAAIAAQEARLSFMLGGEEADLEILRPLFEAMGKSLHPMGAYGAGMQAKVLNNLLAASNTAMTRLVLDWADQLDVDAGKLLALMHASSGQNWFASNFDSIEFSRDGHDPDNTIAIIVKDIESALDAAPEGANRDLPKMVQRSIRGLNSLS